MHQSGPRCVDNTQPAAGVAERRSLADSMLEGTCVAERVSEMARDSDSSKKLDSLGPILECLDQRTESSRRLIASNVCSQAAFLATARRWRLDLACCGRYA